MQSQVSIEKHLVVEDRDLDELLEQAIAPAIHSNVNPAPVNPGAVGGAHRGTAKVRPRLWSMLITSFAPRVGAPLKCGKASRAADETGW